ncbi:MAG: ABC transporter ATP-binding protein [Gammaproteobacteria bacterium]|nr:MAG: ABC transporter ATP-binding protein [Gammaproteobacteria bacterium]RKZ39248.1 MAG: ABC transporter ATP-binding protein [Gammaproteobacteria bacterium]RKZ74220.1 MAG: ABC transporter ATP-binding protein [Gammaproteobacteria bacterium]
MVEIKKLSKDFGSLMAVNDISFQVKQGEVLGFLGPNGAGKSTTMKMITGFLTPSAGSVTVNGHDIVQNPLAVKQRIGYLPEGAPAYPDMTPASFLEFVAQVRGLRGSNKQSRIEDTVKKVHLEGVLYQSIDTLSKGFKRRVGLAQAILHDPEVLILDEPTDGLDPNQKHEVRTLIKNMAEEKVIILSTHILEEVHAVCTRAIIIADGKILADGTPAELEAKSQFHNAVTMTLHCSTAKAKQIRQSLLNLPGVQKLETLAKNNSMQSYQIFPHAHRSIIGEISQHARNQQWKVEELHVNKGRLDEVFRSITTV